MSQCLGFAALSYSPPPPGKCQLPLWGSGSKFPPDQIGSGILEDFAFLWAENVGHWGSWKGSYQFPALCRGLH